MSGTTFISNYDGAQFGRDVHRAVIDSRAQGYEIDHMGFTATLTDNVVTHAVLIIWRKREEPREAK